MKKVILNILMRFVFSFLTIGGLMATLLMFKECIISQGLKACASMIACLGCLAISLMSAYIIGAFVRGGDE